MEYNNGNWFKALQSSGIMNTHADTIGNLSGAVQKVSKAFCTSGHCCGKKFYGKPTKDHDGTSWKRVCDKIEKRVPLEQLTCRDCSHALTWKRVKND